MPSPLTARRTPTRRAPKPTPPKPPPNPLDLGSPLGPYDSNTVRDRVRQWQAQGGGVVTASDLHVAEEDAPAPGPAKSTANDDAATEVLDPGGGESRWRTGRRKENGRDEGGSARSGSAPRKRVVSDGHWRKGRGKGGSAVKVKGGREGEVMPLFEEGVGVRAGRGGEGDCGGKEGDDGIRVEPIRNGDEKSGGDMGKGRFDDGIRVKPIRNGDEKSGREEMGKDRFDYGIRVKPIGEAVDKHGREVKGTPKFDDGIRVKPIRNEPDKHRRDEKGTPQSKRPVYVENFEPEFYKTPSKSRRKSGHLRPAEDDRYDNQSSVSGESRRVSRPPTPTSPGKEHPGTPGEQSTSDVSVKLESSAAEQSSKRRRSSRRKEKISEASPQSAQGEFSDHRGTGRSHKGNILSHVLGESRKVFARAEPVIIPAPRIPSIEAWLSETPDPFVDGDQPPVEIPAPLKSTSKRRKEVEAIVPEDPNQIWEVIEQKEKPTDSGLGSRRRRRVRSSTLYEDILLPEGLTDGSPLHHSSNGGVAAAKLVDLVQEKSPISPPSLRRRGAKRNSSSPGKERHRSSPLRECFTGDEDVSVISSANTMSSVEPLDPSTPLRPPGLNIRRPFPSVGRHRLSTIASVETFDSKLQHARAPTIETLQEATEPSKESRNHECDSQSEARDRFDPDGLDRRPSKSRLAKHSDLISVLSMPMGRSRSIQSARSIRTNRSRLANATVEDLMEELRTDESKYMRELRTLVDGVIPVLLSCVLSKSDSAVAAGLFSATAHGRNDPNITRPIIDMGIALERLGSLHKRIPLRDVDTLLTWAQGAQKVYSEYLKAWRMGFQDVVVNLAPASDDPNSKPDEVLEEGLPRNQDGDIINSDGERVDVAYLLKRPLVRLKYLAKTFKGLTFVKPSTEAELLASKYQNLVIDARRRSNEERARLEDENAAGIDPTRARDPRTLAPLAGVTIDKSRRVRARDYFNLALQHSSGQRVDCRVELLIRDDAPAMGTSGDLLICEVDGTGRWLLFPPVQFGRVSARNGDDKGEIVVMVRGLHAQGEEWHELLSLLSEDEKTGFEWVQMLGLVPVPPQIIRSQSFLSKDNRRKSLPAAPTELQVPSSPSNPNKSRTPSPREVEIPIGEQASVTAKTWTGAVSGYGMLNIPPSPPPKERNRLQKKLPPSPLTSETQPSEGIPMSGSHRHSMPSHRRKDSSTRSPDAARSPRSLNEALRLAGRSPTSLLRTKAKRHSRHADDSSSPKSPSASAFEDDLQRPSLQTVEPLTASPRAGSPECLQKELPSTPHGIVQESLSSRKSTPASEKREKRPTHHRSRSSAPSLELPIIPKVRKDSPPPTPSKDIVEEPEWPVPTVEEIMSKPTTKLTKRRPESMPLKTDIPPPPPPHRSPSPIQVNIPPTPDLSPAAARKFQRRSSSPLKHEYEPSTASESSSDSDASTVEHNEATSISDSSEDEELEDGDAATPLVPLGALKRVPKPSPPRSIYSPPNGTLGPSSSASQAPFKKVPAQPNKASKTIASIFFWSDNGSWQTLHPDECSIVVTPGLIEAFEMSAAHSQTDKPNSPPRPDQETKSDVSARSPSQASDPHSPRPLIALELTPLVPIRRGTALDISIRSPPTSDSKLSSTSNVLFRSRTPEECEALYGLINHARINNPTYIALQNARVTSSFPAFDRSTSTRGSRRSSWFGLGAASRSSYRASSAPTPSISQSDSSIASMSSAFSALKRFALPSGANTRFSIARSSVTSRTSRANSIYTSSDHSSGSGASTPFPPGAGVPPDGTLSAAAPGGGPIGLSNAKIRLYIRETASKWRDLGAARLTIMRPTNATHPPLLTPGPRQGADDKRIVVIGKGKAETLLDVTLGESCFERVARTGIAVSVWEANEGGEVRREGGVVGGRLRVFMIQMKSEMETAYTFSIVGKLRY